MPAYNLPKPQFLPHPQGPSEGEVVSVELKEKMPSSWGEIDKFMWIIMSSQHKIDEEGHPKNGEPHRAVIWTPLSGGPRAYLTKTRETLLGRNLNDDERENFDPDREVIGLLVGYVVVHKPNPQGGVWDNVDSIWKLEEQGGNTNALIEEIIGLEKRANFDDGTLKGLHSKYFPTSIGNAGAQELRAYSNLLMEQVEQQAADSDLPF